MIIIPDVHGRDFWKDPIQDNPEEEVIFLGDYLDPYPAEGITQEKAVEVFMEILGLKKSRPTEVTLLLGNHDLMYLDPTHKSHCCRHDWVRDSEIAGLFLEDLGNFKVAHEAEGHIFSHAGIHPTWLSRHSDLFGESIKTSVEALNKRLWERPTLDALCEFSSFRGGWEYIVGSPVWSDVREWFLKDAPESDVPQIFGHTQLNEGKIVEYNNIKCIDCKRAFKLSNEKLEII